MITLRCYLSFLLRYLHSSCESHGGYNCSTIILSAGVRKMLSLLKSISETLIWLYLGPVSTHFLNVVRDATESTPQAPLKHQMVTVLRKSPHAGVLSCNLNLVYFMDHRCYYLEGQMTVSILRLGYIWQIFSLLWTKQSCVWRERNKVIIASDKIWAFKWKSEVKKTCFHPCEPDISQYCIKTSLIRFAALSKKITFVNIM